MSDRKLIMVVDDEKFIRDVLCTSLENQGYDTVSLEDGLSAISFVKEQKPDMVLLDIKMPGLDGIETCRRLKQMLRSDPRTGIIIITGHVSSEHVKKSFYYGAIDVIKKPFDLDDVNKRINTWFKVKRMTDDELIQRIAYADGVIDSNKRVRDL